MKDEPRTTIRGGSPDRPALADAFRPALGEAARPELGDALRLGLAEAFRISERKLWGLGYRLTGSAADADDIVQQTFVRALERPPPRTDEPLQPWLVRVATNLALDALRRRKRRGYGGAWLPAPIELGADGTPFSPGAWKADADSAQGTARAAAPDGTDVAGATGDRETPEARYETLETVSFAFLLALENLTPRQRAVLVLRDVLDYSARETAAVLGLSEANVRTSHHRARRVMQIYDEHRRPPTDRLQETTRQALEAFLRCLVTRDVKGMERLFSESVRVVTDGGDEFTALHGPLSGAKAAIRFHTRVAERRHEGARFEIRLVNGMPAAVIIFSEQHTRAAPRAVLRCDLDPDGRIGEVHWILASRKLTGVRFPAAGDHPV